MISILSKLKYDFVKVMILLDTSMYYIIDELLVGMIDD